MRIQRAITTLLFASSLSVSTAIAADTPKLETINSTPSANQHKDCPVPHEQTKCDHKNGEPCPLHKHDAHHDKSHEKCDHKR